MAVDGAVFETGCRAVAMPYSAQILASVIAFSSQLNLCLRRHERNHASYVALISCFCGTFVFAVGCGGCVLQDPRLPGHRTLCQVVTSR